VTADERNLLRNPWLAVTLLAAVAVLCTSLGYWQLGRAEQSRELSANLSAAESMPPLTRLPQVEPGAELGDLRFRGLQVEGRYAPERQFLIDGVVRNAVPGYYVLTPFMPVDARRWLIVNRGWVRADPDRSVLPEVAVGAGHRSIAGRIDRLPSPGLRLGEERVPELADEAVQLLSYPTMTELEHRLGRPLQGYQLLLDPEAPQGFDRDWAAPALQPSRHIAYAGQWWLFAAIAAGAACAILWRRLRSE
jgi:surfeit locus 1 family protein